MTQRPQPERLSEERGLPRMLPSGQRPKEPSERGAVTRGAGGFPAEGTAGAKAPNSMRCVAAADT